VRQQNSDVVEDFILPIPQFIYESKSKRIIEIGPHLPVIVKIKVAPFLWPMHGVLSNSLRCQITLSGGYTCGFKGFFCFFTSF